MKQRKMVGLTALGTALIALLGSSPVSATTLEVGGTAQNQKVTFKATLASGSSMILKATNGKAFETCTGSEIEGWTISPFSASAVAGELSKLTFSGCTHTAHTLFTGTFAVGWTSGTNGTVAFAGTEFEVFYTPLRLPIFCETGVADIGTITGVASGHATLHLNVVVDCGFLVPSAEWQGTYTVTSPTALGVVS